MELYVGSQSSDSEQKINLLFKRANRHGLIAGATGTGKTVTLQILAEGFAAAGVPVFITDVKGDLSGLAEPSQMEDFLVKRAGLIGLDPYSPQAFPVIFWDMFGKNGHPVRTTISEMGPLLLSRLLELNDTQQGVLDIVFHKLHTRISSTNNWWCFHVTFQQFYYLSMIASMRNGQICKSLCTRKG